MTTNYSPEFVDLVYARRGVKTATETAAELGMTEGAVRKLWQRTRLRRGGPVLLRRPMPFRAHDDEIYAQRGLKSATFVAKEFGITPSAVRNIWWRGRMARGDAPLANRPMRRCDPESKYSQALVDELYAQRGKKSARVLAAEYGIRRNAIIGIWGRERIRRGDPVKRLRPTERIPANTNRGRRLLSPDRAELVIKSVKVVNQPTVKRKDNPFAGLFKENTARPKRKGFSIREVEAMPINGTGVALLDLPPNGCRWPMGDWNEPATLFCGDKAQCGSSYCQAHHALAYAPQAPWYEQEAA